MITVQFAFNNLSDYFKFTQQLAGDIAKPVATAVVETTGSVAPDLKVEASKPEAPAEGKRKAGRPSKVQPESAAPAEAKSQPIEATVDSKPAAAPTTATDADVRIAINKVVGTKGVAAAKAIVAEFKSAKGTPVTRIGDLQPADNAALIARCNAALAA